MAVLKGLWIGKNVLRSCQLVDLPDWGGRINAYNVRIAF